MKLSALITGLAIALTMFGSAAAADSTKTVYVLPQNIHWFPVTKARSGPVGSHYAYLRGKLGDKCDWVRLNKFPDGFFYPMHVNNAYWLFTVIKGTLVIGFDRGRSKSAERVLPAGSFMEGLVTEPHYGRAIGETIFEIYAPCPKS
jgi:hypothetical protein